MSTTTFGAYSGPMKMRRMINGYSDNRFVGNFVSLLGPSPSHIGALICNSGTFLSGITVTGTSTYSTLSVGTGIFQNLILPNLLNASTIGTDSNGNVIVGGGGSTSTITAGTGLFQTVYATGSGTFSLVNVSTGGNQIILTDSYSSPYAGANVQAIAFISSNVVKATIQTISTNGNVGIFTGGNTIQLGGDGSSAGASAVTFLTSNGGTDISNVRTMTAGTGLFGGVSILNGTVSAGTGIFPSNVAAQAVGTDIAGSYNFVLGDANKFFYVTANSGATLTIPANASVAFPVGTELTAMQYGTGLVAWAITSDTLNSAGSVKTIAAQYTAAVVKKRAATEWILAGNITNP